MDLTCFLNQNPWRRDKETLNFYHFPREILPRLKAKLTVARGDPEESLQTRLRREPQPILMIGPRGSGKSTTLKLLVKSLVEDFSTSVEDIFYFDLDDPLILEGFSTASGPIEFVRSFTSRPAYLMLDEAQRIKEPNIFLNDFLSQNSNIKLILSGTSLSLKSLEPSVSVFYHPSLSFKEYVYSRERRETNQPRLYNLKGKWVNLAGASSPTSVYPRVVPKYLEDYLTCGGYPQLIFKREPVQKRELLEQIFADYINKDIGQFKGITLSDKLVQLVRVLARETDSLVNYQKLSHMTGFDRRTVEKYLEILQETLLISLISPLAQHSRTEISQMDKVYFNDLGLRNLVLDQFGNLSRRIDQEVVVKNFVYNELDRIASGKSIRFWQTRSGAGVDFVIRLNQEFVAIVVKYGPIKKGWYSRTLTNFIKRYHPARVIVVTRDYVDRVKQGEADFMYLPAWWLVALTEVLEMP